MRLFACGCEVGDEFWESTEPHICANRPKYRGTVEKVYTQEPEACQCLDAWTGRRLSKLRRHRDRSECVGAREFIETFKPEGR